MEELHVYGELLVRTSKDLQLKLRKLVVYPSGSLDICNDNEDPDNNG